MKRFFISLCLCSVFLASGAFFPELSDAGASFQKRFVYYVFWSGIRAGKAVFDFKSTPEGIIIKTHATSASFISMFYKVDDFAQSTLYPDGYPKEFFLKVHEGFHRRHKITDFAPRAQDGSQKVIFNNILDQEKIEFKLDKPAYDPLSAFYALTKKDIQVGQSEFIDIFDNKKLWNTEVRVLRKERIRVIAGEFDTIVVKPLLKSEGIFLRKGEMHLWVTDDERKLPVLFTSKAKIGKFKVILAEGDF